MLAWVVHHFFGDIIDIGTDNGIHDLLVHFYKGLDPFGGNNFGTLSNRCGQTNLRISDW